MISACASASAHSSKPPPLRAAAALKSWVKLASSVRLKPDKAILRNCAMNPP